MDDLARELAAGRIDDEDLAHIARLAEAGLAVAAVVHEARQPLSALRIALQLARECDENGEPVREYLADALTQSRRIEDFLERIRDHLRPGDGPSEIRLDQLVRRMLELLDWQLQRGRVKMETRFAADLPPVKAGRSGLEQVVQNLLLNARDALVERRGGGTVTVETRRGAAGEVLLLVGDDGPGVPRQLAERVFEPFFSTKPRERGTGLGLFISRRIARRIGGDLELVAGEEQDRVLPGAGGAVFRLRLPAWTRPASAKRALVVDDEEPIRRLVAKILEGDGFGCLTASDGEQAIELIDSEDFDLLVADKNLPGISGMEVARFARARNREIPVLIITGYASEESAREAVALGISDYVLKPIDLDDFRARLRRAVGLPSELPPPAIRRRFSSIPPAAGERDRGEEIPAAVIPRKPLSVDVLLLEPTGEARRAIAEALTALGCTVAACEDAGAAESHAAAAGFEVLVANSSLLAEVGPRLMERAGPRVLGAIAVMDRGGVDRSIEAIHLGARGVLAPPFTAARVASEFRRTVDRLFDDGNKGRDGNRGGG